MKVRETSQLMRLNDEITTSARVACGYEVDFSINDILREERKRKEMHGEYPRHHIS